MIFRSRKKGKKNRETKDLQIKLIALISYLTKVNFFSQKQSCKTRRWKWWHGGGYFWHGGGLCSDRDEQCNNRGKHNSIISLNYYLCLLYCQYFHRHQRK
jgi:hypothetical protein